MTPKTFNTAPRGRTIAGNTILNLLGHGVPMLIALAGIPKLIASLGTDRFGILTLVWMVLGYFSLFDLGMGRALTKMVAEKIGGGKEEEVPLIVWTGVLSIAVFGIAGMTIASLLTPLTVKVLKIPSILDSETITSFYLLALFIPVVIITAGFKGVLEAYQRFDYVNAIRIPMGIFVFLGPLLIVPFSTSLVPITAVLGVVRLIACLAHVFACYKCAPGLMKQIKFDRRLVKSLFAFGGWMTITNIISPIMVYLDRFFIGAMISAAAVAYYTTPYEIITRFLVIPGALIGVLFPAISTLMVQERQRAAHLYGQSCNYILMIVFPISLMAIIFSYEGLSWWLSPIFARNSSFVLQCLAIGVFLNSLAQVAFSILHGAGRPDWTAKIHLMEAPLYLAVLWILLHLYGINGVAFAWTLRIAVDTVVMFQLSRKVLPEASAIITKTIVGGSYALLALTAALFLEELYIKIIYLCLIAVIYSIYAWNRLLGPSEKEGIIIRLHALSGSVK